MIIGSALEMDGMRLNETLSNPLERRAMLSGDLHFRTPTSLIHDDRWIDPIGDHSGHQAGFSGAEAVGLLSSASAPARLCPRVR